MKTLSRSAARSARAEIPVVTLNIGGRNTNPLEFVLEGDKSELGQQVVQMNSRAQEASADQAAFMAEWNCAANFSAAERARIEVARLEWGDDDAALQLRPPFDLILASDIIYLSEHHPILASTMAALSGPQTVIYNVAPDHGSTILDPVRQSIHFPGD